MNVILNDSERSYVPRGIVKLLRSFAIAQDDSFHVIFVFIFVHLRSSVD